MGEVWFSLGVKSNIAKTVNQALRELKDVDGAISALNEKFVKAQAAYKAALELKADPGVIQSLREEMNAWSKGVDNALQYQGMLQKVNMELKKISTLRNISVGVDKSKLDEAEALLRKFKKDLGNVTYEKLGGTDSNTYLSRYRKALALTLNDVHDKMADFRMDNSLTDAATRTATLERALANVQRRLESIRELQREASKNHYNDGKLLSAGNRLGGVEGRISRMIADPSLLNNEAKYRALLSDIGTAAAKAALDIAKYNSEKNKVISANKEKDIWNDNVSKYKEVLRLIDKVRDLNDLKILQGLNVPSGYIDRMSRLQDLMNRLSTYQSHLGEKGWVANLLKTTQAGSLFKDLTADGRNLQKQIKDNKKAAEQTADNIANNTDRVKAKIRSLYDLLARTYEARNRGKSLGMDTTRLDRDIEFIRGKMQELRALLSNTSALSAKGWKLPSDVEGRLANVLRHIKGITSSMGAAKSRTNEAAVAAQQLASAFDRVHNSASKTSSVISDIKSLFLQGGIVFGVQQFFNEVVKTGGEIEQQHIALKTILGDVGKANELFDQTKRLALESPFTFGELNRDVKQLAAFGVDTDKLYDTTKRLADVAAGLGVSFERLGLAYGQVKSRSWLDGKELRQFAYAGLPLLQKLAEYYNSTRGDRTYSTRDVRDMISKREVSFEDVDAVIQKLTDEGGQFYNLQYVLSETLLGQFNKLKDAWDIMLSKFASGNSIIGTVFKTGIQLATAFIQKIDKLGPVLIAAFSGVMLGKLRGAFAGNLSKGILSAKGSLAADYQRAALAGKKLNATERQILATKGQITARDVQILAKAKAITAQELRRLFIMKKITEEQYKQAMASIGQQGGSRVGAFGSLLLGGIKTGAKSLFAFLGGWPGIILSVVSMGIGRIIQKKQELDEAVNRMQEEQNARYKSVDEFLTDNPASKAKAATTEEERKSAIDSYLEKLKEVAPYNAAAYEMTLREKKSHEERIDYLEQELKLARQASDSMTYGSNTENIVKANKGSFEDAADATKDMEKAYAVFSDTLSRLHISEIRAALPRMRANPQTRGLADELSTAIRQGETLEQLVTRIKREVLSPNGAKVYNVTGWGELSKTLFGNSAVDGYNLPRDLDKRAADYFDSVAKFKKTIDKAYAKIKASIPNFNKNKPADVEEYKQMRESIEAQLELSPANKEIMNIALDDAFGIENNDLQVRLSDKLKDAIDKTFPEIADKIKAGQELNQADREKVQELMKTAETELESSYPMFSDKLKALLADSHFEATIHLAYVEDEWNDLQQRVYNNLPSIINEETKHKYNSYLNNWTKEGSAYKARNAAKQTIDDLRNELAATKDMFSKGGASQADVNKAQENYQTAVDAALYGLKYDYKDELKKSNKKSGNNAADAAARKADAAQEKRLSARLKLIQDAYSMYKKYFDLYGKDKAIEIVRKNFEDLRPGDFANLTSLDGLIKLYEQFVKEVKNTKWRRPKDMKDRADSLIASARTSSQTAEYDRDKDAMEKWASQESLWLDRLTKQWDLYDKVRKATGDKALAMRLSGFDGDDFANQAKALEDRIVSSLDDMGIKQGLKFDELFGMSDEQIEDYVKKMLGTTNDDTRIKAIVADLKKWRDLEEQVRREGVEGYAELMGSVESYGNTIKKLNDDLQTYIDKLAAARNSGTISQADYENGVAVKTAQYELKKIEASAATQLYMGQTVNNMTRARGRQVYDAYIVQLNKAFKTGAISAKDYADKVKKVNEQYGKLDTATSDTSAFITGGLDGLFSDREQKGQSMIDQGAKDYEEYKDQYEKFKNVGDEQGMQNAHDGMEKAQEMSKNGSAMMKGAGQAAQTVAIIDKIVKTINANVQSLKALFDDIAETIDVFGGDAEKFKSSNGYAFVSGFAEASKGATDAWNSLKSGNAMGVLEGGYRSIMAWPMAFARARDARLQQKIEKLSEDVSKIEDYTETLSKAQERTLGYDQGNLLRNYRNYYSSTVKPSYYVRGVGYDYYSTLGAYGKGMAEYYSRGGADIDLNGYEQQYNLLIKKRKDYIDMYNAESAKKKNSKQSLEEYKQKIAELDDQVRFFSEDLAKSLWDVDLKGWAEQLGDALMTAFENGEDAAEAFDQSVTSILQGLVKKMLITGMIEPQLEALRKELFGYTDEKGVQHKGTFDAEHPQESQEAAFGTINKYLGDDGSITRALPSYEEFFNSYEARANKEGNTLMNSDSANMSSSIKGMTEQTADLLASYLNAIRADVSVIRQLYGTKAIAYMDSMSVMARSQVQYQSQIAQNTLRNAEAAETIVQTQNNIIYILNAVVNDTKQFNVRAK